METKLTVRVPEQLLREAKRYARQNGTTLTRLISAYLLRITQEAPDLEDAPIVRRLSGSLSQEVSERDYRDYVENKYRAG